MAEMLWLIYLDWSLNMLWDVGWDQSQLNKIREIKIH
jgi:hypothetical protein